MKLLLSVLFSLVLAIQAHSQLLESDFSAIVLESQGQVAGNNGNGNGNGNGNNGNHGNGNNGNHGQGGLNSVPEPSTTAAGLMLLGLVGFYRKR